MTESLQTELLLDWTSIERMSGEWMELQLRGAAGACYFNDPRRILSQRGLYQQPCVVFVRKAAKLVAVASFVVVPEAFSFQIGGRPILRRSPATLRGFGDDFLICDSDSDSDAAIEDATKAVLSALGKWQERAPDAFVGVYLRSLLVDGPIMRCCRNIRNITPRWKSICLQSHPEPQWQINMAETFDEYLQTLGKESRRSARRFVRQYYRETKGSFRCFTESADVTEFLGQLNEVYRRTWQCKDHSNPRERNSPVDIEMYERIAQCGWLRAYVLASDDKPVAYWLGFQYGGVYESVETGYDPNAADLSPGTVILAEVLRDLHETNRPRLFRFGWGDMPYKRRYGNVTHDTQHLYLVPQGGFRRLLLSQYWLDYVSRRYILKFLRKTGLESAILALLRRNR